MSNPKKSFIKKPIVEKEIKTLESAYKCYLKFKRHILADEYFHQKYIDLLTKSQISTRAFFDSGDTPDNMPEWYYSKQHHKYWEGKTTEKLAIVEMLQAVVVFKYKYEFADWITSDFFEFCKCTFLKKDEKLKNLPYIVHRLLRALKKEVPYLYDENGNKYSP